MKADSQLREEAEDQLAKNPAIDANRIGVAVADGIVTLSSQVPTYVQKVAAEKSVLGIAGVVAVIVHIDVVLHEADPSSDENLALSASAVLDWIAGLEKSAVKIKVERGWMTLSGEVRDGYRSRTAEKYSRTRPASRPCSDWQGLRDRTLSRAASGKPGRRRRARASRAKRSKSISGSHGGADTVRSQDIRGRAVAHQSQRRTTGLPG
ncbi:BON domain-containing protein [Paraburkholderia sp. Cpub6]|uniref:BON domain-containing protein n=1 Tax=Paraburkholderia sp. Cpub6 TaxID=2723094 RepID=UPI001613646C|nr:BON domain-containing protein [Paraburkholderia sp. Cpub6]MBB5461042.1 hypothetical protein [Paraburkholderia sp. Cpub6]